ncbi:hypothetical protein X943_000459 [Babesia divergens]|uniref:U3 small nucleolar RNA-associated protein 6 N-terminal domain-containing protein n=1 Tax=Babesia divergens TaxID=32595 RepID=A0AAD9G6I4_BABDI|nr:hypothetical protein X943_000459 [Babesia divergens]
MAARVQQQLEDMVPELRKLKELQLFNEDEVRDIVKHRRKYEYMVISTDPVFSRNSYKEYISYELELDRLLQGRLRKAQKLSKNSSVSMNVESDRGSVPIRVVVRRRIHRIFKRCLTRFVTAIDLWKEYCAFCYRIKAFGVMNRAIMAALAKNPTCEPLWKIAAKYTLTLKGSIAAKNVVQMALRANPRSLALFILLLEQEVHSTHQVFQYSQDPDTKDHTVVDQVELSAKTWSIIVSHAINALQGGDVFKMLFFAAALCARVQQLTLFAKELKDYGEFAAMVFNEMFNSRHKHPLLGLYVWQHRLLESLLMQKHEGTEAVPSPSKVFSAIMEDCKCNHAMMPIVSQFINTVVSSEINNVGKQEHVNSESLWMVDVEGSLMSPSNKVEDNTGTSFQICEDPEDDMDKYCENIECLKDICFLRQISPDFDQKNQACPYTRGMLNRRSLLKLKEVYSEFISEKLSNTIRSITAAADTMRGEELHAALHSNTDELVEFLMQQIAVPGAFIYNINAYRLALQLVKRLSDGPRKAFTDVVKHSMLCSIGNPELSEIERNKMVSLLLRSDHFSIDTKLEVTQKSFVNLTQQQLLSAVGSAVHSIADDTSMLEVVLSLMSASYAVLVEDFIKESEVVHRIFAAMLRRMPALFEALQNYRGNRLTLRNFSLLSVVASFWQVYCTMEKLNSEIKQAGCSEFLNDNCEAASQAYASVARKVVDLCENALEASAHVSITDNVKKAQFMNRCWNQYLKCAKDLEQLDLLLPIFNLHTFNISSDSIAARAFAQLGKNFVVNSN